MTLSKSSSNANRETTGGGSKREREREREKEQDEERKEKEGEGEELEEEGLEGRTFPAPEKRKCMAMHNLARPVLVLVIKEHEGSRLRSQRETRRK